MYIYDDKIKTKIYWVIKINVIIFYNFNKD